MVGVQGLVSGGSKGAVSPSRNVHMLFDVCS